jgi:Tfp pilus assembly protein FimT
MAVAIGLLAVLLLASSLRNRKPLTNHAPRVNLQIGSSKNKQRMKLSKKEPKLVSDAGFSVLELLILIVVVGIITAITLNSFQRSNRSLDLSSAARNLSAYLEKARSDSISRHGGASVEINSTSSYTVNIDFIGDGTSTARTINLPSGTALSYTLPPATASIDPSETPITITYDWRGRTAGAIVLTLTDATAQVAASTVVVGPAGDLSIDTPYNGPVITPTPHNTTVVTTTGIKSMRY